MLTQALVKRLFNYDPLTGVLTWRIWRSNKTYAGTQAGTKAYKRDGKPLCRMVRINYKGYVEARVIWLWMTGVWLPTEIDHADNNPFNNSWSNLREATDNENSANRLNQRPGRLKWTRLHKSGKYWSYVKWQGKGYYTGTFNTELEAHAAAYALAQQLHGPFVRR